MGSTFSGLEIGKRALWAQQKSLEVTGHNIANANTEGYSRQEAIQSATTPRSVFGAGQIGTGVEVSEVRRARSDFIDKQIRKETRTKGYWKIKDDSLNELELIFNEPSDKGIQQTMSDFWNSMQDLNNKPESKAVRATVRQRALALTDSFNHIDTQLDDYKLSLNSRVQSTVQDINSHANRIADLNRQIVRIESDNQDANDLRDKRTKLVNELSELTNIQVKENDVGSLRISVSGRGLVQGDSTNELAVKPDSTNDNLYQVEWSNGNSLTLKDGKLKGLIEVRDQDIDNYRSQLDNMASQLITEFNQQHKSGYGLDTVNHVESNTNVLDPNNNLNLTGDFDIKVDGGAPSGSTHNLTVNAGDSLSDLKNTIDGLGDVNASINAKSESIDDINSALGYEGNFDIEVDGNVSSINIKAGDSLNDIKNKINLRVNSTSSSDITGDGNPNSLVDTSGDGKFDNIDLNNDGNGDGIDSDGDGIIDKLDINGDGTAEDIDFFDIAANSFSNLDNANSNINSHNQLEINSSGGNEVRLFNPTGTDDVIDKLGINHNLEIEGTGNKISLESTSGNNVLQNLNIGSGQDFFNGHDASSIDLMANLKTDDGIQDIAAATKMADINGDGVNDYAGDGDNALDLSELSSEKIMDSGTATFSDYYGSNIAQLGVESQRAERMVGNQDTLLTSLEQQQESVSGVSLDEEMNKMIKYQHSYNAAAKIVSTMDELLGTIVNGLKR